jgi:transcription elongation GreA/GreB family factor
MTDEIRKRFKELLRKKDADGLDSLWLELTEANEKLETLFELTDTLLKSELRDKVATLLSVLLSHLKERNEPTGALLVLKRLAQLTPNERYLRRELGVAFFQAYPDRPRLETFVSKSELTDDKPMLEAVEFINRCLAFDAGNFVYDSEMGMGKVTELDLMVDKLVVDFGKGKPVTYHLGAAFKHLTPVNQEHFLIRKESDAESLREMAVRDPLELLRNLLKSFDRPLKPREIKAYLEGIVAEDQWDGFWTRVRRLAANEPNIRAHTKPERSFQWVTPARGAKPAAAEAPELIEPRFEPGPAEVPVEETKVAEPTPVAEAPRDAAKPEPEIVAPAPEPEPPPAPAKPKPSLPRTVDEFLAALKLDAAPEFWKSTLTKAQDALKGDWPELYRQAFLETEDRRIWTLILKELQAAERSGIAELAKLVWTYYKRYPAQFLYLFRNPEKYELSADRKGLFSRLLDLLDSDKHKSSWSEIKAWLTEDNDRFLRETFKELNQEDMHRFWSRVEQLRVLEDYRKDEIRKLIQEVHPQVGAEPEAEKEVLFSTQQGIDRKEAELRQIRDVDIPKSTEDVGRAREFGDLSENYEYKAAKEKQARLLARLAQLQRDLAIAKPIDFARVEISQVNIGTRVKVEEAPSGDVQEFMILGPWDIDPDHGTISYQAPFAQRLMGKRVGDFVPANPNMPGGKGHKILEITRAF